MRCYFIVLDASLELCIVNWMFIVGLYEFELTSCVWLCAEIDVSQCFSSRLCWTICWYVWNWFCDLKMPDEDCSADFCACMVIYWILCRLRMLFLSFLSLLIQTAAWKWNSNVHELIYVRMFNVGFGGLLFWLLLSFLYRPWIC